MNTLNNTEHLDEFARKSFSSATANVSANTHYRLEQAVNAAVRAPGQLAASNRPSRQWKWFGFGIGGGALLASVIAVMLWNPSTRSVTSPAPSVASVPASISTDPNVWSTDLDEDPSMYAWLASKEALAVAR